MPGPKASQKLPAVETSLKNRGVDTGKERKPARKRFTTTAFCNWIYVPVGVNTHKPENLGTRVLIQVVTTHHASATDLKPQIHPSQPVPSLPP